MAYTRPAKPPSGPGMPERRSARPSARHARRFTKQMKKIQSVLGDHQDAVVARGVDRELGIGAHLAGENAFTFGLLYEREDQRAARLRAEAQRTWNGPQAPVRPVAKLAEGLS